MLKMRYVVVAAAALAAASCSKQGAPAQLAPTGDAQVQNAGALPFEVPQGAQFVARTPRSTNLYRIGEACRPLHEMNPERVVFYWTLEAGIKAGYRLSKEEGCR